MLFDAGEWSVAVPNHVAMPPMGIARKPDVLSGGSFIVVHQLDQVSILRTSVEVI